MPTLAAALALLVAQDLGKLTVATGTVEVKAGGAEWQPLASGTPVPAGAWVRTAEKARGLVRYADGSELLLDHATEVRLDSRDKLQVKTGRIMLVPAGPEFNIRADRTSVTSRQTLMVGQNNETQRTRVIQVKGKSTVATRRYRQFVMAGYWCEVVRGALNTPDQAGDTTLVTAWTHELLAKTDAGKQELQQRFQGMLTKLGTLPQYEQGFREAGELSVPFLVKYLKIPATAQETARRQDAAKILADVCGASSAGHLVALLRDIDGEVRASAGRGLARLAGNDLGFNDAYWKGTSLDRGQTAWAEWLKTRPQ